ncbi:hypothetical protein HPB48_022081 [Haemaphysalis longicornis]|uniref:Uncharacterized protein n=1 Tax=Haemaphysalis longicornis TaxID=44386 RepID=A0A9J6FRE8_HAELO|nr:hypothetical protein HPB48_022081 [Haemaphysalis longicornis]
MPPGAPPPRITTEDEDACIIAAAVQDPFQSAEAIRHTLDLDKRRPKQSYCIPEATFHNFEQERQLQFATQHASWIIDDWDRVIFSDESTFCPRPDQRVAPVKQVLAYGARCHDMALIGAPDELMESPMADDNVIRLSWYQGLMAKAFFYLVQDEGYASRLAEDTFNLENDIALAKMVDAPGDSAALYERVVVKNLLPLPQVLYQMWAHMFVYSSRSRSIYSRHFSIPKAQGEPMLACYALLEPVLGATFAATLMRRHQSISVHKIKTLLQQVQEGILQLLKASPFMTNEMISVVSDKPPHRVIAEAMELWDSGIHPRCSRATQERSGHGTDEVCKSSGQLDDGVKKISGGRGIRCHVGTQFAHVRSAPR